MARHAPQTQEEVLVELLIRVEGSAHLSRITTFKVPVVTLSRGDDEVPGQVQFESRTLIRRIIQAVRALI